MYSAMELQNFRKITYQIRPGNDKQIVRKLKSLNIQYTAEKLQIYVSLLLKVAVNCKEKSETVAKILTKFPEEINVSLDDDDDYQEIVMTLLFQLEDSNGSGKIKLYEKLAEENFNNQKEIINMLMYFTSLMKDLNTTESACWLLQYIEGCKKYLNPQSLSMNAQRKVNEIVGSLIVHAADRKVTQETQKILIKIFRALPSKSVKTSEEIDEIFVKMVESIRNDEEIVARVIDKDYKRDAIFYLENVKDSKTAVKFASALKQLQAIGYGEFVDEIITQNEYNFYRQHSKESRNKFFNEKILTSRFTAELIFQGTITIKMGEMCRKVIAMNKPVSQLSQSCCNVLILARGAKIMYESSKSMNDFGEIKT